MLIILSLNSGKKSHKKPTKILLGNQSSRFLRCFKFLWNPFYFWKENLDVFSWSFFPFCRTTKCCVFCGCNLFVAMAMVYNIPTFSLYFLQFRFVLCLAHFFQLSRNRYDIFLKALLPHCTTLKIYRKSSKWFVNFRHNWLGVEKKQLHLLLFKR